MPTGVINPAPTVEENKEIDDTVQDIVQKANAGAGGGKNRTIIAVAALAVVIFFVLYYLLTSGYL